MVRNLALIILIAAPLLGLNCHAIDQKTLRSGDVEYDPILNCVAQRILRPHHHRWSFGIVRKLELLEKEGTTEDIRAWTDQLISDHLISDEKRVLALNIRAEIEEDPIPWLKQILNYPEIIHCRQMLQIGLLVAGDHARQNRFQLAADLFTPMYDLAERQNYPIDPDILLSTVVAYLKSGEPDFGWQLVTEQLTKLATRDRMLLLARWTGVQIPEMTFYCDDTPGTEAVCVASPGTIELQMAESFLEMGNTSQARSRISLAMALCRDQFAESCSSQRVAGNLWLAAIELDEGNQEEAGRYIELAIEEETLSAVQAILHNLARSIRSNP